MGLRTKFNLVLLAALGVGLAVAAVLSYRIMQDNARDEVLAKARIMMESALALRSYTTQEIRPLLVGQMDERFLPHIVPSYAAQTNFRMLRERFPEYTYKEAALNPTNLADRATDWEADIIHTFRNNPALDEWVSERTTPAGQSLVLARPLQVNDQSCLLCHGTAENAPATMVAIYGDRNGFGWEMNETIGAQVVSVPMSVPLDRAWNTFVIFMVTLFGVFLLIAVLLNVMLQYVVIKPVMRISQMASEVSMGNLDVPEYEHGGRDEIASLSSSFNRMRRSLESAMRMLNE
jgi:protein-histidine pros-kinase